MASRRTGPAAAGGLPLRPALGSVPVNSAAPQAVKVQPRSSSGFADDPTLAPLLPSSGA
jgi:hypothetical protein